MRLGTSVTRRSRALAPDGVLVATGARRARPTLPGAERRTSSAATISRGSCAGTIRPSGSASPSSARPWPASPWPTTCSARGREVHLLEDGPTLGAAMAHPRRWRALHDLRERGVTLVANARAQAIGAQSLHASVREGGATR